ncbi:MAG: 3-phosphoshikimate 1-carboxyvinyltransferase [Thermodesulfovibrio sp.]|nr:3-phosphoshikimate 1-carboxyvinyltransferase [Thermodesulfovibrio sp.]
MKRVKIKKAKSLKGETVPPPDKSISHRAVMFASLAEGKSIVRNFLMAEDPISTMNAMRMLGVEIREAKSKKSEFIINGKGLHGLKEPVDVINCGNSGTTMRLISGILAGNPFLSVLTGDDSLRQRPMARIIKPLKEMGADISGRAEDKYPPIVIKGKRLKAMDYTLPVASAQVKSCLILAGLYSDGITSITEPHKSRDHTERMLKSMGASIGVEGLTVKIHGSTKLTACDITVPADFSSAAFFMAGALMVPDSEVVIKDVGINPTRTGFLEVIKNMGAGFSLENVRDVSGEPVADIYCRTAPRLKSVKIGRKTIPSIIDEFPILCVLASRADGITEIRGAEELRVKESDRIKAMVSELKKLGAEIEEFPDGIAIKGQMDLRGNVVESYGDHRIAMALSIAALAADGTTTINNASCVDISFPGFFEELRKLHA